MTGYRSGFVCAQPQIVDALRSFRPTVGTAPQEFVQRASVAAWSDDAHVEDVRALYHRKRETLLPALESAGLRLAGSTATFYLWMDVGGPSEPFARRLLDHGIVAAPGSVFGAGAGTAIWLAEVSTIIFHDPAFASALDGVNGLKGSVDGMSLPHPANPVNTSVPPNRIR